MQRFKSQEQYQWLARTMPLTYKAGNADYEGRLPALLPNRSSLLALKGMSNNHPYARDTYQLSQLGLAQAMGSSKGPWSMEVLQASQVLTYNPNQDRGSLSGTVCICSGAGGRAESQAHPRSFGDSETSLISPLFLTCS